MFPSDDHSLRQSLDANWLTWLALSHLLPATILRELFVLIIAKISHRTLTFSDLFEELPMSGPTGLEIWHIRMRSVSGPLATYLQHRLQHILWRNDADAYVPDGDLSQSDRSGATRQLEIAVQLGRSDFGDAPLPDPITRPTSSHSLYTLIAAGKQYSAIGQLDNLLPVASEQLVDEEPAIAIAVIKHLGDLCVDADAWGAAKKFYENARERLSAEFSEGWTPFVLGTGDILAQSIATSIRVLEGPGPAFELLHLSLESADLRQRPIFVTNAAFDALTAQIATGAFHNYDRRATLFAPTYFHGSYNLDPVWGSVNNRNYAEASRQCWSILRRQIALGLTSEVRATKSVFCRVLLGSLEDLKKHDPAAFGAAVRLLLESGDSSITKFKWDQKVVDRYVDCRIVAELTEVAQRNAGVRSERERVAIEILCSWLLCLRGDKQDVANDMLRYLTTMARLRPVSFMSNLDVGGRSLEILKDVAENRPEFISGCSHDLQTAIVARLSADEFWRGKSSAIELALECSDIFSPEELDQIVDEILNVLDAQNPSAQMWPIVRPALQFLTSKPSVSLYKRKHDLGRRVLDTILRFGIQETQSSQLIFYLRSFDPSLLRDSKIIADLQPVLADLRKKALTLNSSGTVGDIQALLLSPTISGVEGVKDAFAALKAVISSSHDKRPRIALAYSYAPLQMLINRQQDFSEELALPKSEVEAMWVEVYEGILDLWDQVARRPEILASFGLIPREESDPVLVHNWTFASLRFAESLGKREIMEGVVARAAEKQDSLRGAIQRALVIGASLDEDVPISPAEITDEAPDVFYDALGRRLVVMASMEEAAAREICGVLLKQCMQFGPRGLDAAVLVSASRYGLAGQVGSTLADNYVRRVDADRILRLSLLPLLGALKLNVL
jgi:hypothetical protein